MGCILATCASASTTTTDARPRTISAPPPRIATLREDPESEAAPDTHAPDAGSSTALANALARVAALEQQVAELNVALSARDAQVTTLQAALTKAQVSNGHRGGRK